MSMEGVILGIEMICKKLSWTVYYQITLDWSPFSIWSQKTILVTFKSHHVVTFKSENNKTRAIL